MGQARAKRAGRRLIGQIEALLKQHTGAGCMSRCVVMSGRDGHFS
jgi:hypothetical protein